MMEERQERTEPAREPAVESETRSPGLFEALYGILFKPRHTLPVSGPRPIPVWYGFIIVLLVTILTASRQAMVDLPVFASLGSSALTVYVAAVSMSSVVLWLVVAGVTATMLELLGGRGEIRQLLAWQGLAMTPRLLEVPAAAVGAAVPGLTLLLPLLIGLWSVALYVLAGRSTYRVSVGSSIVGSLILPLILIIVLVVGMALGLAMVIASWGLPDIPGLWP